MIGKNSKVEDCKILDLNHNREIINIGDIPFAVKRIYYLYDIQNNSIRGEHAHKDLYQVIIGLNEGLVIKIDDGRNERTFNLRNPSEGLLLVPGIWRSLGSFSCGSICLVLASEPYLEDDYLRN